MTEGHHSPAGVLLRLLLVVGPLVLLLAWAANWYAANVSLPRYCDDPSETLAQLEKLLHEARPGEEYRLYGEEAKLAERRPYLVAAKLLYLQPRRSGEGDEAYLGRLAIYLEQQCSGE